MAVGKTHYQYFVQCQVYMGMSNMKKTVIIVLCKNDQSLHIEGFDFDKNLYNFAQS